MAGESKTPPQPLPTREGLSCGTVAQTNKPTLYATLKSE